MPSISPTRVPSSGPTSATSTDSGLSGNVIAGISVGAASLGILLFVAFCYFYSERRKANSGVSPFSSTDETSNTRAFSDINPARSKKYEVAAVEINGEQRT